MERGKQYKKNLWTVEEDRILMDYIKVHGKGQWNRIAKRTGLKRCGKSCRLRWMNYLSPSVKRGNFTEEEEDLIIRLHKLLGNRWSLIAGRVPGRTDNQVKNHWNTYLSKRLGIKKSISKVNACSITNSSEANASERPENSHHYCESECVDPELKVNNEGMQEAAEASESQQAMMGEGCQNSLWLLEDYSDFSAPSLMDFLNDCNFDFAWHEL